MANYRDIGVADVTFTADADLTAKQYYFVTVASTVGNVKTATGASNPAPVGVLQNSPSAGQEARVRVIGFTKLVGEINSTCNVNWGRYLICASDGQAESVNTAGGSPVAGRWYDANISSGSAIGQAFVNCAGFSPCHAAAS